MPQSQRYSSSIDYTLLLSVGFIWGFQYILTELSIESFTTWTITFFRIAIGALILTLCLLFRTGYSLPGPNYFLKHLGDFIIIGFFETTLPWTLINWSQDQLPSSFTAILIGTVPLFATFLEVFFIKNNSVTSEKTIAIVIGLLGIFVLVGPKMCGPNIMDSFSLSLPGLPIVAMLLASMSFAVSLLLIKVRLTKELPALEAAQGIFIGALVSATPLFLFMVQPWKVTSLYYAHSSLWALLILGALCGSFIYIFYLKLIKRTGPSFASTTNYFSLAVATLISITFQGTRVSFNIIGGFFLIIIALWVMRDPRHHTVRLK